MITAWIILPIGHIAYTGTLSNGRINTQIVQIGLPIEKYQLSRLITISWWINWKANKCCRNPKSLNGKYADNPLCWLDIVMLNVVFVISSLVNASLSNLNRKCQFLELHIWQLYHNETKSTIENENDCVNSAAALGGYNYRNSSQCSDGSIERASKYCRNPKSFNGTYKDKPWWWLLAYSM